jgi:hypothetical protein
VKLQDLFETFYMTKMTPEQQKKYDAEIERWREMSHRERKEEYKPFGKLGKLAKPEHVIRHRVFGTNKHEWAFAAQYPGKIEQRCRQCGASRQVSEKGNILYR